MHTHNDMNKSMPRGLTRCPQGHTFSDVLSRCPYCPERNEMVYLGVDYGNGEDVMAGTIMEGNKIKGFVTFNKCIRCKTMNVDVKNFECTGCGFKGKICEDCITDHILNEHT